ncbi:ribosome recycling factor [Candidatus Dependentiae bacterium]|nr:ribosome recycling factor [Candidatus Dependentiae bacterium]
MKKIVLVENNSKDFEKHMDEEMLKAIKHFEHELVKIRTNRAHTSMVEDLPVSCYGQAPMPLKNVAALSAPEPKLIVIQPWDVSVIADIEKAILSSDLGLNPLNDGKLIRLQLPDISTSRRDELIKLLHKKLEECKIAIRNIRKDFNNLSRDAKKEKTISENFANRLDDLVQKVTDKFIAQAQKLSDTKEKDLKVF